MRTLITGAISLRDAELDRLKDLGCEITIQDSEWDVTFLPEQYEYIICNRLFDYNKIESFSNLRFLQFTSTGIAEEISEYSAQNNIKVKNASNVYCIPMAEAVVMQILNICRHTSNFIALQRQHIWEKNRNCIELFGKRALLIGYGNVGREIAKRLHAFGIEIVAANRSIKKDGWIKDCVLLCEICNEIKRADFVVVGIAEAKNTINLINKAVFDSMKAGSVFLNVSRGKIVDEDAFIDTLKSGKLLGAAVDVTAWEPLIPESPIWDFENVYVTPHNSFIGDGVHERLFELIYKNLAIYTRKG